MHDKAQAKIVEIFAFDSVVGAKPRFTNSGFLVANPKVARAGVQTYSGAELGLPEIDSVRLYRPPEEVFSKDSMLSLAHRTVTLDHPNEDVSAENWKDHAVGWSDGQVVRDGDFIRVPMMLADSAAVNEWKVGKRQLSVGYNAEIHFTPGKLADGTEYDAVQRNIRANHIAVVAAARGGSELRIGDDNGNDKGDQAMNLKKMLLDGINVDVSDTAEQVITRMLQAKDAQVTTLTADQKKLSDSVADLTTKLTDAQKLVSTKDAEIATLKKQVEDAKLKPDQLDALVKDRAETIGKATAILGDALVAQGKSIAEIQRQVVDHELKDSAKGWTDDQVAISFKTLTAAVKVGDGMNGGNGGIDYSAPVYDAARSFSMPTNMQTEVDKAYEERNQHLQNAWRKNKPQQIDNNQRR